jgi:serine phosphatase RsbU (regulator of sigma subunit)/PAS domain-containing protein
MPAGTSLSERILSGQGPEFAALLESLGEAVTVRGLDGQLVYANRPAREALGFPSLKLVREQPLHTAMAEYVIRDESGAIVTLDDFPSARVLRGEAAEPLLIYSVHVPTGEAKWELLKATPLRDGDGKMIAAVTMIENVTAVKTADVRTRVLAESGRTLASSLDYQQTLVNVANIAVPALADWCMVELVDRAGVREDIVIAHRDPAQRRLAVRMRELEPLKPQPQQAIGRVLTGGESLLFHDVSDDHLVRVSHSAEQLKVLRALKIRSAIVVPMQVPSRMIGVMSFFTSESRRRLTDDDLGLAEQLARRAAVAVENSRLHTQLGQIADTLQQSLKPSELPDVPGWEVAALYRPADAAQRIEVGGDFYEVFDSGSGCLAVIGDVTGHGVAAATVAGLMRQGARFVSHLEPDPVRIVRRLHQELRQRQGSAMCSVLCAALQDHSLVLASAGHPPALIVDHGGRVTQAPLSGPLLGAFPDSSWHQERVEVSEGELVLLYTDGVTEAAGQTERFGPKRLRRLLSAHAEASPQQLLTALEEELDRFRDGEPTDDVAALALRPR